MGSGDASALGVAACADSPLGCPALSDWAIDEGVGLCGDAAGCDALGSVGLDSLAAVWLAGSRSELGCVSGAASL